MLTPSQLKAKYHFAALVKFGLDVDEAEILIILLTDFIEEKEFRGNLTDAARKGRKKREK